MAKLRVKDIAYRHTDDIDLTRVAHSKEWDKLANVCVGKGTNALKNPSVYTGPQSDHVSDVFLAMQITQRTIRRVLEPGRDDPTSVDALALARLQLEGLYTLCLSVSNSLSGRHWELDQVPAVGDPTDIVQLGTGHRVAASEGQRRVALQRRVAAYLVVGGLEVAKVSVQDHGHARTAPGREILAASCRSGSPRMGVTEAHEARS